MSKIEVDQVDPQSGTTLTLGTSGDTISIPAGVTLANSGTATGFASIAWQSTIVTGTTLSAVAGNGYWIDTTSNLCTITLPASASVGDQIIFSDYKRTWGTNRITINQNSLNYQGQTSPNPEYNTSGQTVSIVYSGATQGWIPTSDDDVTDEVPQTIATDFLVIAGGGAGASSVGGGGGAGGYRSSYNNESSGGGGSAETALALFEGTTYTITVGAGGTNPGTGQKGTDGSNSSISGADITTITSIGGGAGGLYPSLPAANGNAGGSGGGGSGLNSPTVNTGGSGTANQGYDGGAGSFAAPEGKAAGGGGAGAIGGNGSGTVGGNGGNGVASTITGSSVTRGGGGGGSGRNGVGGGAGSGGSGGGGAGGTSPTPGTNGTANTGGGGGGTHDVQAANGGSGVVILRLLASKYTGTTTGSPTVTDDGSYKVLTYTASGSYTA